MGATSNGDPDEVPSVKVFDRYSRGTWAPSHRLVPQRQVLESAGEEFTDSLFVDRPRESTDVQDVDNPELVGRVTG